MRYLLLKEEKKMEKYRNLFSDKTEKELVIIYEQFLEFEKTGFIPEETELVGIRDEYYKQFGPSSLPMIQFDLLHTISAVWYEKKNQK